MQRTIALLRRIFGHDHVLVAETDRIRASRDRSPRNLTDDGDRSLASVVVMPHGADHERQLHELMDLALSSEPKLRLVARGGGTGVCRALHGTEGDVIVDLSRLNTVAVGPDPSRRGERMLFAGAGATGADIDRALAREALPLTHGHYPASYQVSTFGGWVQAGSSGQYAARFGTVGDRVSQVRGVDGMKRWFEKSASACQDVIGLEGTTAFLTRGVMPLERLPAEEVFLAFELPDVARAAAFLHELHQFKDTLRTRGADLYAVRCYDWFDATFIAKPHKGDGGSSDGRGRLHRAAERWLCRHGTSVYGLLRTLETSRKTPWIGLAYLRAGTRFAAAFARENIAEIVMGHGGTMRFGGLALNWHEHRFKLNYEKLLARRDDGIIADTFDCAMPWHAVAETYEAVRWAFSSHGVVGAHLCMDRHGPYLYFTFALPGTERRRHVDAWEDALTACIATGARTNHHHGIGRVKIGRSGALAASANGREWYDRARAAKMRMDPHRVLNPDNLV